MNISSRFLCKMQGMGIIMFMSKRKLLVSVQAFLLIFSFMFCVVMPQNADAAVSYKGGTFNAIDTSPIPVAGSALDLSYLNDAPAGKYGSVRINADGNFYFEDQPNKAIKFYGANINWNQWHGTNAQIDGLVDRVSRMGYNIVRIHSQDAMEDWSMGIFKKPTSTSIEFDTVKLERLDYFISKLKEKGIYIVTDLFHMFDLRSVPGCSQYLDASGDSQNSKYLLPFVPAAYDIWKQAASMWLNHVNQYTGVALKDDPMLVQVSPWNEQLSVNMGTWNTNEAFRTYLLNSYNSFLTSIGQAQVAVFPESFWATSGTARSNLMQFLTKKNFEVFNNMKAYIKNTIGSDAIIGGLNYIDNDYINYWRSELAESTETHLYYQFGGENIDGGCTWNPGQSSYPLSQVFNITGQWVPSYEGQTQYLNYYPHLSLYEEYGKPYTLTEWHDSMPGVGREEAGLFVGAVAAFQDWDDLNRFVLGVGENDAVADLYLGAGGPFSIVSDPLAIMSEYAGNLLFRTGNIASGTTKFAIILDKDYCKTNSVASGDSPYNVNMEYLPHLFNIATVYADKDTDWALYNVEGVSASDIKSGNIPASKKINITTAMTFKQVAQACIDSLSNSSLKNSMTTYLNQNVLMSDTQEMYFNVANSVLKIDADKIVGISGTMNNALYSFQNASVQCGGARGSFFAASLDNKNLEESNRILLSYMTDVAGTGESIVDGNYNYGSLHTLARQETGTFKLTTALTPGNYKAYRLTLNGVRIEEIPVNVNGNVISIDVSTVKGLNFELVYNAAATNNLVANPGFENGMTGWTNWGSTSAVTGNAKSGTYSARTGLDANGFIQNITTGITSGGKYTFSAWGKADSGQIQSAGLICKNSSGAALQTFDLPNFTSTAYEQRTMTVTLPANTASVDIQTWKTGTNGYGYLDDVSLTKEQDTTVPDTTAPAKVTGLTVAEKTGTSVKLSWTASTDNIGVTGYDVYNGTAKVNTAAITGTSYNVEGLSPSTSYKFTVVARDAAGNLSAASDAVTVSTMAANLVTNPGFENGMTGWVNWGNTLIVTGNAKSGTYSARTGLVEDGFIQTITAGIVAGGRYTFSAWGKVQSGQIETASLICKDSSGASLKTFDLANFNSTSYVQKTMTITLPANTASVVIQTWKTGTNGYGYLDDFSLIKN
jgi:chitodextrinase